MVRLLPFAVAGKMSVCIPQAPGEESLLSLIPKLKAGI